MLFDFLGIDHDVVAVAVAVGPAQPKRSRTAGWGHWRNLTPEQRELRGSKLQEGRTKARLQRAKAILVPIGEPQHVLNTYSRFVLYPYCICTCIRIVYVMEAVSRTPRDRHVLNTYSRIVLYPNCIRIGTNMAKGVVAAVSQGLKQIAGKCKLRARLDHRLLRAATKDAGKITVGVLKFFSSRGCKAGRLAGWLAENDGVLMCSL